MAFPADTLPGRIAFRPMTRNDLPMEAGWLRVPEVGEWWKDPEEQLSLVMGNPNQPSILDDRLLTDGVPALVVDPDPSNERAVRAYRRAGFAGDRTTTGWDGNSVLILERWP